MAGWIKMPLGTEVGLGPGDIVLDGNPPTPLPKKKGTRPSIFGRFYCGQTNGSLKMPLGREVGLGPVDIVLDGYPALPFPKGHSPPPIFGHICCGQTA